jgi:hypothetical protein
MTASVNVQLTFRSESTAWDRDSDIAYLEEFFGSLVRECSAFKSYRITTIAPAAAGDDQ